jgi:hypothetical protein
VGRKPAKMNTVLVFLSRRGSMTAFFLMAMNFATLTIKTPNFYGHSNVLS